MRRLCRLPPLACLRSHGGARASRCRRRCRKSELLTESDLVALVRIKSVTCTGVTKDERTGEELPS